MEMPRWLSRAYSQACMTIAFAKTIFRPQGCELQDVGFFALVSCDLLPSEC